MLKKIDTLEEQMAIINSYSVRRMQGKTQVIFNDDKKNIHVRNRLTHSFEVATIAKKIAINIKEKSILSVDPDIVFNVGLCHDLGHPPMGHVGQKILNKKFSKLGLFFDDNANTLNVIEKDLKKISDITKVSLIKYPFLIKNNTDKGLYKKQYHYYIPILKEIVDIQNVNPNVARIRTYESEIMELADDIAYLTSDIEDAIGYYKVKIKNKYLKKLAQELNFENFEFLNLLNKLNKDNIQEELHKMKLEFIDDISFSFKENKFIESKEMIKRKEILRRICFDLYINKHSVLVKDKLMKEYELYLEFLISNINNSTILKEHMISRTYLNKLLEAKTTKKKLKYLLLSIAELTDQWVLKKIKKNERKYY